MASGVGSLRASIRPFRLRRLPLSLRPYAALSLAAIGGWCVLLLVAGAGLGLAYDPWRRPAGLMGTGAVGPTFVRVTTITSLAVAVAACVAAAWEPGWSATRAGRAVRAAVVFGAASVGLAFAVRQSLHGTWYDPATTPLAAQLRGLWGGGLAWAGVIAAVAVVLLPYDDQLARRLAPALVVLPLAGTLLAGFGTGRLTLAWQALGDWRSDPALHLADSLQLLLVLFLAWELGAWAEVVGAGCAVVARRLPGGAPAALWFLGLKVVWLGAGLAGVLPGVLGGHAEVWEMARRDGPASWVLAGVIAAVAAGAMTRRRGPAEAPTPVLWKPLLLILGVLLGPGLVAGVLEVARVSWPHIVVPTGLLDLGQTLAVVLGVALVVGGIHAVGDPDVPPRRDFALAIAALVLLLGFLASGLHALALFEPVARFERRSPFPDQVPLLEYATGGQYTANYFVAPGVAFVVSVVLAVRAWRAGSGPDADGQRWLIPGTFAITLAGVALLFVVPHLPQVPVGYDIQDVGASGDMLAPLRSYLVHDLRPVEWFGGWNGPAGTFELASFDAAFTVGACWLAWRAWRSSRAEPAQISLPDWRTLSFVLLGSTVLAHSSTLMVGGWVGNHWYYVAFVVPVVWQTVLHGDELNELAERRPAFVVLNLAVIVLLLTVIGYRLLTGTLNPAVPFQDAAFPYGRGITIQFTLVALGALSLNRWLRGPAS